MTKITYIYILFYPEYIKPLDIISQFSKGGCQTYSDPPVQKTGVLTPGCPFWRP